MQTQTAGASTADWLIASKDLKVRAYIETDFSLMPQGHRGPITESIFGENIKDAIRITKEWLSSRD